MRRLRAPPLLRPLQPAESFLYVLGGILLPALCFLAAAADLPIRPSSKQSGWRGFLLLLFDPAANWALGLLLAGSALALGAVLQDMARHGGKPLVRAAILGGVLVSALYVVAGSLGDEHMLKANLCALVLYVVLRRITIAYSPFANAALVVVLAGGLVAGVAEPGLPLFGAFFGMLAGPAWSLAAYAAMSRRLWLEPSVGRPRMRVQLAFWCAGFGAALAHGLLEASRLYRELPADPPPSCYVATAAARGHPRLVGSWEAGGRRVNAQLIRLKAFEIALARTAPSIHAAARMVYDRIGPALAARIRHPLAADIAYLSLKPAEWVARALAVLSRSRRP